jgi:hypothetical protein
MEIFHQINKIAAFATIPPIPIDYLQLSYVVGQGQCGADPLQEKGIPVHVHRDPDTRRHSADFHPVSKVSCEGSRRQCCGSGMFIPDPGS